MSEQGPGAGAGCGAGKVRGISFLISTLLRVSAVRFCLSDHPMSRSPDHPILGGTPPPIRQLGFQSTYAPHPSRSQIGVRFSDYPSFGVGFGVVFTKYQEPIAKSPFLSKTVQRTTFSLWSEFPLYYLLAFLSSKNASSPIKKLSIHGVEQAVYACGDIGVRTAL